MKDDRWAAVPEERNRPPIFPLAWLIVICLGLGLSACGWMMFLFVMIGGA